VAGTTPVSAADKTTIPLASHARKGEPLPAGDRIELSLGRAITLALENTLDLDVASYNYERASFGISGAQGAFDPFVQLDLSAERSQSPTFVSTQAGDTKTQKGNLTFGGLLEWGTTYQAGWNNQRQDSFSQGFTLYNPSYQSNLYLSATQPLLRNFGKAVQTRFIVQARITRDLTAWDFVRSVQLAVQNVENAYWDLLYAQESLLAKKEALDRAKDLNRITKIKIDVGALAPIDIVQTEVTIAQREQDIIIAEGQIGDAQDRLKRLLNVNTAADWGRPIVPTDRPGYDEVRVDLEAGLRTALETRPEVKQAVMDIESKKITFAYSKNQVQPRLDLKGSYNQAGAGTQLESQGLNYVDAIYQIRGREFPGWSIGATLNFPLFNRAARAGVAQATTDLELSRTNLALLKQNLQVEVRAAARGIDTAYRSVAAARKARELAERNVDAEKKKFENGMTTSFQVSQIQNDLTSATSAELLSVASYRKAITAWHKAIGDLLTEKGVSIAGLPVTLDPTPAEEGALR